MHNSKRHHNCPVHHHKATKKLVWLITSWYSLTTYRYLSLRVNCTSWFTHPVSKRTADELSEGLPISISSIANIWNIILSETCQHWFAHRVAASARSCWLEELGEDSNAPRTPGACYWWWWMSPNTNAPLWISQGNRECSDVMTLKSQVLYSWPGTVQF